MPDQERITGHREEREEASLEASRRSESRETQGNKGIFEIVFVRSCHPVPLSRLWCFVSLHRCYPASLQLARIFL